MSLLKHDITLIVFKKPKNFPWGYPLGFRVTMISMFIIFLLESITKCVNLLEKGIRLELQSLYNCIHCLQFPLAMY